MIYQGWRAERWETPFSDVDSLIVVSIVDNTSLQVIVEDARGTPRRRWCVDFGRVPGYLNLQEEFRLELWGHLHNAEVKRGWTITIPDSPWLARLSKSEALLRVHHPNLTHYQLSSEDDVIDVLAPGPPVIAEIAPAEADESSTGRSRTLYYPEDRDEVEKLVRQIRRGDTHR